MSLTIVILSLPTLIVLLMTLIISLMTLIVSLTTLIVLLMTLIVLLATLIVLLTKMSGFALLLFVLVKTSIARTLSLILLSSLLCSSARVGLDAEKKM